MPRLPAAWGGAGGCGALGLVFSGPGDLAQLHPWPPHLPAAIPSHVRESASALGNAGGAGVVVDSAGASGERSHGSGLSCDEQEAEISRFLGSLGSTELGSAVGSWGTATGVSKASQGESPNSPQLSVGTPTAPFRSSGLESVGDGLASNPEVTPRPLPALHPAHEGPQMPTRAWQAESPPSPRTPPPRRAQADRSHRGVHALTDLSPQLPACAQQRHLPERSGGASSGADAASEARPLPADECSEPGVCGPTAAAAGVEPSKSAASTEASGDSSKPTDEDASLHLLEVPVSEARLVPCSHCKRKFRADRLPVHEDICRRKSEAAGQCRQTWESKKQRCSELASRWWMDEASSPGSPLKEAASERHRRAQPAAKPTPPTRPARAAADPSGSAAPLAGSRGSSEGAPASSTRPAPSARPAPKAAAGPRASSSGGRAWPQPGARTPAPAAPAGVAPFTPSHTAKSPFASTAPAPERGATASPALAASPRLSLSRRSGSTGRLTGRGSTSTTARPSSACTSASRLGREIPARGPRRQGETHASPSMLGASAKNSPSGAPHGSQHIEQRHQRGAESSRWESRISRPSSAPSCGKRASLVPAPGASLIPSPVARRAAAEASPTARRTSDSAGRIPNGEGAAPGASLIPSPSRRVAAEASLAARRASETAGKTPNSGHAFHGGKDATPQSRRARIGKPAERHRAADPSPAGQLATGASLAAGSFHEALGPHRRQQSVLSESSADLLRTMIQDVANLGGQVDQILARQKQQLPPPVAEGVSQACAPPLAQPPMSDLCDHADLEAELTWGHTPALLSEACSVPACRRGGEGLGGLR